MRSATEERKQAVLGAWAALPLPAKSLESDEVSAEYIGKARQGEKADHGSFARLGAMYEQAAPVDANAAAEWVEGILRAAGIAVTLIPDSMVVAEAGELVRLVARAGAAQGEFDAAVLRATDDNAIGPEEDADVQRRYRAQQRLDLAISLSVRRMAEQRRPPQGGGAR